MKNIINTAKKVLDVEIAGITKLHKSIDKEFAIMDGIVFHPPPLLLPLKGSRGRQT